jgi:hypothetical protein
MSAQGHSRPMHSVPINVRCYSDSDVTVRRSEVTVRAKKRLMHRGKKVALSSKSREQTPSGSTLSPK